MSKVIVVTGCSSGFGRQASEALARKGHRVYATMRAPTGKNAPIAAQLKATAAAGRLDLHVLDLDVTSTASVEAAAKQVLKEVAAPDVVINNAGQMYVGITEAFSADEVTSQLDVNLVGVHRMNLAFLPGMRKRGTGLFINISSIAGRMGVPFYAVYHASKWALEGYSNALRMELASSGVDVVVVEPGPFSTSLFPGMRTPADKEGRAATYPKIAHETLAALGGRFEAVFKDPGAPTNPALVVNRIVELAEMKPGTLPFRSVVGLDFGVRDRNAAVEPLDAGLIEGMGLKSFATLKARGAV